MISAIFELGFLILAYRLEAWEAMRVISPPDVVKL